ncbi:polysaccharide biosynthesis tyrosine autokinase [Levilinea saccharolytica]|uniref:non-specific protein-tyrosine kinase n=1 Tax=Levilinea saccharolytica TaxID=229921 RepID=A0A0P6XS00_9CHLR|nr:polysaccharide biosynthesis tyrosine autokinase [Levilinea saccharolytica]KPL79549.1 hypothetical protein ADN01_14350 [Levilinea saccharolytica]GAP18016.1 capsular exopolysaccharide family [Levilinea saccharolytica]
MELRGYLNILTRRLWVVLVVFVITTVTAYFVSTLIPPTYQANVSLRVKTPLSGNLSYVQYETYYANRLMNTYARISTSEKVLDELKAQLGVSKLLDVEVLIVPDSELIQITVKDQDPALAAKAANLLAEIIVSTNTRTQVNESAAANNLTILTDRLADYKSEIAQANTDYETLLEESTKISAQIAVLDRSIKMKEDAYQTLKQQFDQASINEITGLLAYQKDQARQTKELLSAEISTLETELADLSAQYQEWMPKSVETAERLSITRQTIQTKEQAYNNLLAEYDAARTSSALLQNSQDLLVVNPAVTPTEPTGPGKLLVLALGAAIGLLVGIILAFLVESLDTRIQTVEQVQNLCGCRMIGQIPALRTADKSDPLASSDTAVQKAFWTLRGHLVTDARSRNIKTILFTSASTGEGKSTTVFATATSLAKLKQKILVIDSDVRLPKQHDLFKSPLYPGLVNLLSEEANLDHVIQKDARPGMDFIPAGLLQSDPLDVFQDPNLERILIQLKKRYDFILIDTPSLAVAETSILAQLADGVVILAKLGETTSPALRTSFTQLENVDAKIIGSIATYVPVDRAHGYYHKKPSRRLLVHWPTLPAWLNVGKLKKLIIKKPNHVERSSEP